MWLWRMWWQLHAQRPRDGGGMGASIPRPIPWRDITAWCDRYGFGSDDEELAFACCTAMDGVFFKHWDTEYRRSEAQREARARSRARI